MVKIGYLSAGYYIVCFSPVFSLFATAILPFLWIWERTNWLLPMISFALIQILVICIQISGLFLCLYGYKKKEPIPFRFLINIFLVLWGILIVNWAWFSYNDTLEWSRNPGMRSLIIWDYIEFETWAIKGLLWVVSGLIFISAQLIQETRKAKTDNKVWKHTSDWVD